MHMARHQHIGMQLAAMSTYCIMQAIQLGMVITGIEKDGITTVTTLDNIHSHTRDEKPWFPWHLLLLVNTRVTNLPNPKKSTSGF